MKNKILFNLFLFSALGLVYLTMSSSDDGVYNGGTNCSPCHGSSSTVTTVLLDGVPNKYLIGQTYSFTVTVINPTKSKAGFNLKASGGQFFAGTGSKTNTDKSEITHTAPKTISGGNASFSFNWTAPTTASGTVNFNLAGNAVNGDGNATADDQWSAITSSVGIGSPASVESSLLPQIKCYPNPVQNRLTIEGMYHSFTNLTCFNTMGQPIRIQPVNTQGGLSIDCTHLNPGTYFITGMIYGKKVSTSFLKD